MNKLAYVAAMIAGMLTLSASAAAENVLYLNCKCTAVYNSSFPSRSPECGLYHIPDFTAIVDFSTGTIDLKSSDQFLKGLSGPAAISPGTISARWDNIPANQSARKVDLAIDRTSGEYTLGWDFGETKIRWSGICRKGDPLPTQF